MDASEVLSNDYDKIEDNDQHVLIKNHCETLENEVDRKEMIIPEEDLVSKTISVDEVLELTGGFKMYQVLVQLAVGYFLSFNAYQTLLLYFTADNPPWICKENATNPFCVKNPGRISVSSDNFDERCKFNRTDWKYVTDNRYSILTEFDLVCDRKSTNALITSVFYIGWGVAGIFAGTFADYFGRKVMLIASSILLFGASVAGGFAVNIWQIIVIRILIGAGYGSANTCAFIVLSEIIVERYRALSANLYQIPFFLSVFMLIGCAYFERDWRKLTIYISLPGGLGILIYLFVPESLRWLVTTGKQDKAELIVQKIGKVNRRPLKKHFKLDIKENSTTNETATESYSYLDLFRNCYVTVQVMLMSFTWITAGAVYFGLSFAASGLGGGIYMDLFLLTLVDVLASFICIFLLAKFGRKVPVAGSYFISSIFLFAIAGIPETFPYMETLKTVFAMIGKCCISIVFNAIYLWSFEIYPTVVRSQGFTICQIAGRIGSAAAPFIVTDLRSVLMQLPYIVFGGLSFLSAFACFLLPETSKIPTRELFEDFFPSKSQKKDMEVTYPT